MTRLKRLAAILGLTFAVATACTPEQMAAWLEMKGKPVPEDPAELAALAEVAENFWSAHAQHQAQGLRWPVSGTVTSGYGWRWGRMHHGIDISAPSGTTVVASKDGTATSAKWDGAYGNVIVIDHGDGETTLYAHLSSIWLEPGQWVQRGSGIGAVGATGNATGPHLHYELTLNGSRVNPISHLP